MESPTSGPHIETTRPAPGPAGVRPIWDGEKAAPPPVYTPPPEPTASQWSKDLAFGPARNPKRITGLDAARGCALLGMIAVHVLPPYNEYTGRPTFVWQMVAGHAAALFAVLAGVTVALVTGSNNPYSGRKMRRARVSLAARAVLILLIGLAIDELAFPVYDILPYYGLMFLAAIPLTGARIRTLLAWAAAFIVFGPVAVFFTNARIDYTTTYNPNFTSLFSMPADTLLTLLVGGTYPLVTWMSYLCVGIAIGRLNLRWLLTHVRLIVFGAGLAFLGSFLSTILIDYLGGFAELYYYTDGFEAEDIVDVLDYGPDGHLPTDTLWWLAVNGPHTDTTADLLTSIGLAMFAIGALLVVTRMLNDLLYPLIAAGSMTLTLYVAHLIVYSAFADSVDTYPVTWFFAQVIVAVMFASAWQLARGRGPLEALVSRFCKRAGYVFVPEPPEPVVVKQEADQ
ncbi:DUF418 domain-containing protein [Corynebacterium senegalense]|uniref:DUF418 domain-containing protein n=1 Tax=Corynebacterium senegalense TaxID=2080750 RepID=UPI000E206F65|nr:heparan-alpha-glucosaminide N-acetyltransferase domain-containing protein [Corynebacterium senegalense]